MLARVALRSSARVPLVSSRCFSVQTLSDLNSVNDFIKKNKKSVLYYTATWCPRECRSTPDGAEQD